MSGGGRKGTKKEISFCRVLYFILYGLLYINLN